MHGTASPAGQMGKPAGADLILARFPPIAWCAAGLLGGQALCAIGTVAGTPLGLATLGILCASRRHVLLRLAGCALLAAALGHAQMDRLLQPQLAETHVARCPAGNATLRARVAARPRRAGSRVRFLAEVEAIRTSGGWRRCTGRIWVTVRQAEQRWQRGDRFEGGLRLRRPRNFGNPGEFDYEHYLARRGIYVTGFAANDASWQRRPGSLALRAPFERWRERLALSIEAEAPDAAGEILKALLIGGTDLAPAVRERYARTGLSHVLAISGLHVGLVAGAALVGWRWLLARSEWMLLHCNVPKLAIGLTCLPVVVYGGIAGGSVPTMRAVLMGMMLAAATLIDRQRHWAASLSMAALLIHLLWPGSLFEISFQLSFCAVTAIVLGMRRITEWWSRVEAAHLLRFRGRRWRVVRWLVLYAAVTVCATAGTLPLTAWHFNLVSLIGPLANPVLVPLLGLAPVSLGLFAALTVPFFPAVAALLLRTAGAIIAAVDGAVGLLADLPIAAARVVTPTALELALVYGGLTALLLRGRQRYWLLAICGALLCVDAAIWAQHRFFRGELRVTFLSVGHGDCAVVEFPGSTTMVIDGGGLSRSFDVGERLIAPYLWQRKIGRIDQLVLTHPDFDHYGGLSALARLFTPREFWWNGTHPTSAQFDRLWRAVAAAGARPVRARRGLRRVIEGVEILVLAPDPAASAAGNDGSLVLQLRYGRSTFLFTGDLETTGEVHLLGSARNALPSHVLKIPHHGSRRSSSPAFLNAVRPGVAVVSVGHDDRFGMPHREVLEAYRARGVSMWRTDEDGAVTLTATPHGHIVLSGARSGRRVEMLVTLDTPSNASLKRGGTRG